MTINDTQILTAQQVVKNELGEEVSECVIISNHSYSHGWVNACWCHVMWCNHDDIIGVIVIWAQS
jgi:hypothetical protein